MEVAHLSDVHVKAPRHARARWRDYLSKRWIGGLNLLLHRSHPEELLEAAVTDIAAHPPDHLVVTGDMTNLALPGEFARAREHLDATGVPPERVSLIPGNHDAYVHSVYRQRRFEQAFAPYVGGEDVTWPRAQEREGVLIVSTNSSVPTPWFTAHGRLGPEQLEAVGALLDASAAPFKMVLVHHPPLLGDGTLDGRWRRNRDGPALVELCQRHGADVILCGHTHRPFRYRVPGGDKPLHVICGGSTTYPVKEVGHGGTYNRYTIEDGHLAAIEVRAFDPDLDAFRTWKRVVPGEEDE